MPLWKQAMLRRLYQEVAGDGSEGGAGGSTPEVKKDESQPEVKTEPVKSGPSDEEARLLKENMRRKEALDKLTKEFEGAKSVLAQLQELGGLDALKSMVDEKKTQETKSLEAKGEWDRLRQRMAEEHAKVVEQVKAEATQKNDALAKAMAQINELTVGTAFGNSKFIAEDLVLTPSKTRVVYGDHFDLVDGKVVGYDKPRGSGDRTPLVDSSGNPVAFDDALRKIVEADADKESMLRSKVRSGAGSDTKKMGDTQKKADPAYGAAKIAAGLQVLGALR